MSVADGSRLHVHEFSDGSRVLHRDETDPERGPIEAATHWLAESNSGRFALMLGLGFIVLWLVKEASR